MARRRPRAPLTSDNPEYWRPIESRIERERRLEHAARGEYKYRGRWLTRAQILARILGSSMLKNAVVEPRERPLLWGGQSLFRVTVPGTDFEMFVRAQPGETFESFMTAMRAAQAQGEDEDE